MSRPFLLCIIYLILRIFRNFYKDGDNSSDFTVIHNGVISNDKALKKFLTSKGFEFETDTDSECISNLLNFLYLEHDGQISFADLVQEALQFLEGTFAIVVKSSSLGF